MDWFSELTPQRNTLIERLHLPDPKTWPEQVSPTAPPPAFPLEPPADPAHPERDKRNWRRPVFRVTEHRGVRGGVLAGLFAVLASTLFRMPPQLLVVFVVVSSVAGYLGGRRLRHDVCSDASCRAHIPSGVERCERCGGFIAGRIARASERLEAEEKLPASFFVENELDPPAGED